MQLTALAIALQGIGYGAALTALHGLTEDTAAPPVEITPAPLGAVYSASTARPHQRARPFRVIRPDAAWQNYLDALIQKEQIATAKKHRREEEELIAML